MIQGRNYTTKIRTFHFVGSCEIPEFSHSDKTEFRVNFDENYQRMLLTQRRVSAFLQSSDSHMSEVILQEITDTMYMMHNRNKELRKVIIKPFQSTKAVPSVSITFRSLLFWPALVNLLKDFLPDTSTYLALGLFLPMIVKDSSFVNPIVKRLKDISDRGLNKSDELAHVVDDMNGIISRWIYHIEDETEVAKSTEQQTNRSEFLRREFFEEIQINLLQLQQKADDLDAGFHEMLRILYEARMENDKDPRFDSLPSL